LGYFGLKLEHIARLKQGRNSQRGPRPHVVPWWRRLRGGIKKEKAVTAKRE